MAAPDPTRRGVLMAAAAVSAFSLGAAVPLGWQRLARLRNRPASNALDLGWEDLIPGGPNPLAQTLDDLGINDVRHLLGIIPNQRIAPVTEAYNGKQVRLPGFMVPLSYEGTGVIDFLLVPYVGACIHVPPPPSNQIVFVSSTTPYDVVGYFEPVDVEGEMQTQSMSTDLAEVGYVIADARVTRFE
ncbi:MAG: DUF3299 domain-containing protein [Pseudomonadota bacterium]